MRLVLSLFLLATTAAFAAEPARLKLTLHDAETQAVAASDRIAAARFSERAANARALASSSQRRPQLALEGSYRYLSEVPALTLPGGTSQTIGDNNNYSLGPTLTWLLFDAGALRKSAESAERGASARAAETRATETEVRLAVRSTYFGVQNAIERMRLVIDSLRLAEARYADISRRVEAGVATRADLLTAHTDALDFELRLRQAQSDLAASLADLLALTGENDRYDLTYPAEIDFLAKPHASLGSPTLLVHLDPIPDTLVALQSVPKAATPYSAQLEVLAHQAEASRLAAAGQDAAHWPRLQFYARSSLDYPNGPILEQFNQNILGINLAMPLFDGGRIDALADESRAQARSLEHQRAQLTTELRQQWDKVTSRLTSLEQQRNLAATAATEAQKVAELMFLSYRAGRTRYLEVQNANLRALEWSVNLALIETQLLNQLAVQASLSEGAP